MDLKLNWEVTTTYKSESQIARVLTEYWVSKNVYCPSCGMDKLENFENNMPVADFYCSKCSAEYELKSKKDVFASKIVDGSFGKMIQRIHSENNPNFFFLNYSRKTLGVINFLVIPKYFFNDDIIEKRKPLGLNARRAGWVGCNIILNNIPESGKIFFIKDEIIKLRKEVIKNWQKTSFLANQKSDSRGWTIEIIKIVERIKKKKFTLKEIYSYEKELQWKFPNNSFIKDKIRQQLQLLRDRGLIEFNGMGTYTKVQ